LDKWLWAARFYKTRSIAQQAVERGKVRLNSERVKPAKELKPGDALSIQIGAYAWAVNVVKLSDKRGPAAVAQTLYEETPDSRARRTEQFVMRKFVSDPSAERHGRPTKRERRQLDRWRES
ncbi:MAG TPA: RNA-binding S4 domain-containing protein, partial [Burkholderiales bacterium]|nr:RNA-binding S4 domain-containing protein [Burkholderiales bacterium]